MRNVIIVFTSIPCFDGKSNSVALSFQPVVIIFKEPLLSSLRRLINTFASISAYTLQLPVQWVSQKRGPRRLRGQLVLKKYSLHSLQFDLMFFERLINKIFSWHEIVIFLRNRCKRSNILQRKIEFLKKMKNNLF